MRCVKLQSPIWKGLGEAVKAGGLCYLSTLGNRHRIPNDAHAEGGIFRLALEEFILTVPRLWQRPVHLGRTLSSGKKDNDYPRGGSPARYIPRKVEGILRFPKSPTLEEAGDGHRAGRFSPESPQFTGMECLGIRRMA